MSFLINISNLKIDPDRIYNTNDISLNLECAIDLLVPLNPVKCNICESLYCPDCIKDIKKCPLCMEDGITFVSTKNTIIEYEIKKILIYCKNKYEGCPFVSNISNIELHEKSCQYNKLKCINLDCDKEIPKIEMVTHLIKDCSSKRINCLYCKERKNLINYSEHIEECRNNYKICYSCGLFHKIENDLIENDANSCPSKIEICGNCSMPELKSLINNNSHRCIEVNINNNNRQKILLKYFTELSQKLKKNYNANYKTFSVEFENIINNIDLLSKTCEMAYQKVLSHYEKEQIEKNLSMNNLIKNLIANKKENLNLINDNINLISSVISSIRHNLKSFDSEYRNKILELENDYNSSKIVKENNLNY